MEFNQKSRGQKHHKNKARYKSKLHKTQNKPSEPSQDHKKILKTSDSTSSDSDDEEVENESVEWNDFSLLAKAPISVGGHFQFKSDKNAETDGGLESLQQNKLFSLDLNILQYSLNCIPFHERCGIDKSYFTESELVNMNARAHSNKVQYESYLRSISSLMSKSEKATDGIQVVQLPTDLLNEALQKTDLSAESKKDLYDNSEQQHSSNTNADTTEKAKVDKEELEDWLDDILGN